MKVWIAWEIIGYGSSEFKILGVYDTEEDAREVTSDSGDKEFDGPFIVSTKGREE